MRAAIVNYEMDSDVVSKIPGYEGYAKAVIPPEKDRGLCRAVRQDRHLRHAANGDRAARRAEAIYDPQAFMPHLYYGGMPQDEAVRNMRMFAATVMPEIKSWQRRARSTTPSSGGGVSADLPRWSSTRRCSALKR
jgi:hypothetical protein